jgi:hypothetical protein
MLIPELKYHFTLPMCSPERKQVAIHTHRELAQLNPEHWTESIVRLWFNIHNKKYPPENATTIPTDDICGEPPLDFFLPVLHSLLLLPLLRPPVSAQRFQGA